MGQFFFVNMMGGGVIGNVFVVVSIELVEWDVEVFDVF